MCAGEGAADGADGGAEKERGLPEGGPTLRAEMQRADISGLLTASACGCSVSSVFRVFH